MITVTDNVGLDGVDTLFNIERCSSRTAPSTRRCRAPGTTVPNVVNQTQAQATTNLTNALFSVMVATANSPTVLAGRVISQNPAGGQPATVGSTVGIVVSLGPLLVAVPNVVGSTLAGATTSLQSSGLRGDEHHRHQRGPGGPGAHSEPGPAATRRSGSTVALSVSAGPAVGGLVVALGFEEAAGNALVDSAPGRSTASWLAARRRRRAWPSASSAARSRSTAAIRQACRTAPQRSST